MARRPLGKGGDVVWVNQHAYDIMWQGRRIRVYLKRLRPLRPISDSLLRASGMTLAAFMGVV